MSTIFALFPGSIPLYNELEQTLSSTYSVVQVGKVESLSEYQDEEGVVILGGKSERINSIIGMVRTIAPKLGCVIIIEEDQLDSIDASTASLADLLVLPAHKTEILARINMAMHMSELHHLIEESAQVDEGTGLYNHQFFLKRLGEEMSLSKRHLSPVTCVVLGVSYYDVYMDSYGYQFVTNFMHQVAKVCQAQARTEDVVAKLGDSEIAFLLPRSTEKGALSQTKRVISRIEELPLYMGDQIEHLFIKAGIAGYPSLDGIDMDPDTVIRYARHALHHARCSEDIKIQLFSEMRPFVEQ